MIVIGFAIGLIAWFVVAPHEAARLAVAVLNIAKMAAEAVVTFFSSIINWLTNQFQ